MRGWHRIRGRSRQLRCSYRQAREHPDRLAPRRDRPRDRRSRPECRRGPVPAGRRRTAGPARGRVHGHVGASLRARARRACRARRLRLSHSPRSDCRAARLRSVGPRAAAAVRGPARRRVTADERRAIAYGLVVTAGFVAIDAALGDARISSSYALGSIVAGVLGGFRAAAFVSVVAITLAALSGIWNDDFGAQGYFARLFVAFCGALLALGAGRLRDQVANQLGRQEMLTAVADLPAPGATLDQTVARVTDLLVPRYAGFAAIDTEPAGQRVRGGLRGDEPVATSDVVETPLRARGHRIGTLAIADGRGGADSPEFLRVFAGRVALALDNTGLSAELVTVEQQLEAILENLGEAVTVQDRSGRLVFANSAAAGLLGAASVEELLSSRPEDLVARFTSVKEDGSPLDVASLPGRAVLEGREAEPLVVRSRDNETGEERWRLTKATPVRAPGGDVLLAVNVIE